MSSARKAASELRFTQDSHWSRNSPARQGSNRPSQLTGHFLGGDVQETEEKAIHSRAGGDQRQTEDIDGRLDRVLATKPGGT